ncbi:dihydrodipicolinate synthase family protein [Snodgrassella sp. CFCC 13594]|uniref:dihydrodipicolinate synthase family protein n=1 Tax=Snodgrassella sp. CFCC 13594 TaxID=1775559 RepID=UPI0008315086|nr:dihydrodipicolinate synthase family protein [Snodgrassella sp. CFCC 13594]
MFSGLSAFSLTPIYKNNVDKVAFASLIQRLVPSGVDSIGVLGSTGCYAYLSMKERAQAARIAIEHAGNVPVIVGISATNTRDVLSLADDAQKAGARGVLLAPVSYQKLTEDEVFSLYKTVTQQLSVPLCIYDNPLTTHFTFTDELHGRIAELPNVGSIKIPAVSSDPIVAKARIEHLRNIIPSHVTIGISGDACAASGLNAGCEAWYSVIGGLFPEIAMAITQAAQASNAEEATRLSNCLKPLWNLFAEYGGSLRVIATAAELLGFVSSPSLPPPLMSIKGHGRQQLAELLVELKLG